jgi:hypothetical protein
MRVAHAGRRQRRHRRARAGDGNDAQPRFQHCLHQQRSGIADRGRSGIADESHALSLPQQRDHFFRRNALVMLVHRHQPVRTDTVVRQEVRGVARVLRRDRIRRAQYFQRAQGDIAQIPNRGGNYI